MFQRSANGEPRVLHTEEGITIIAVRENLRAKAAGQPRFRHVVRCQDSPDLRRISPVRYIILPRQGHRYRVQPAGGLGFLSGKNFDEPQDAITYAAEQVLKQTRKRLEAAQRKLDSREQREIRRQETEARKKRQEQQMRQDMEETATDLDQTLDKLALPDDDPYSDA